MNSARDRARLRRAISMSMLDLDDDELLLLAVCAFMLTRGGLDQSVVNASLLIAARKQTEGIEAERVDCSEAAT